MDDEGMRINMLEQAEQEDNEQPEWSNSEKTIRKHSIDIAHDDPRRSARLISKISDIQRSYTISKCHDWLPKRP